jgi:hypothetical protein
MKHALAVLFICSALAWAGSADAPDYNLNVHVTSSRMVMERGGGAHFQKVKAVIDGKQYELESIAAPNALLMPGDYKARIVKDHHSSEDDVWRIYEFQLPDKKPRQFLMIGVFE